jgi:transposase
LRWHPALMRSFYSIRPGGMSSKKLPVPDNITLLPLPPKSPELNPVENIWQFMRDNWLSNRVFNSYDDILDHCCFAWNKLIDMPWKIMSIGTREWAYRS